MAVVLAFRVAIVLAGHGTRKLLTGPVGSEGQLPTITRQQLQRLGDPSRSDAQLEEELSAQLATVVSVTTFAEPFELRHFSMQFTQGGALGAPDDHRQCGFDILKLVGGNPSDAWVAGDFTTVADALTNFWLAIDNEFASATVLDRLVAHRRGPGLTPPLPAVWEADRNLPGLVTTGGNLPPAVAISVTEKTSSRRKWGRFYLPAPNWLALTPATGRITSSTCTAIADAADAMYQTLKAANLPVVVYSPPKPRRWPGSSDPRYQTKGDYPAEPGVALTVDQLQVDDVPDVIRSRRHKRRTLAVQRDVT